MRVILVEDVDRLGKKGAVLNVANGYGRNFLIPRKLAVPATEGNLKQVEMRKKKVQVQEAKEEKDAGQIKQELEKLSISILMKAGEGDVLFGSVTSADIADVLEKNGYTIDKRRVELEEPIKRLGTYQVNVRLHKNVIASVKVEVERE
jgi:large subunit ribosomal protein L9